ncbi:NUDIX hydrolase [Fulvimarina endophytica]|uniref:NUDIX hydrolase n=1 Tax=Fulvimarina endophytica TaxID=2293836 RepID=UPI0011C068D1|nr:NUDIX hydrolase [Fulvimarina endophytica]
MDLEHDEPRFLMGLRNRDHRFMPSVYVFPGGAVESGDLLLSSRFQLSLDARTRLGAATTFDASCLSALPLAAIRETFEETGEILGEDAAFAEPPENWAAFANEGYRPACDGLVPVARAITPPGYPIRYDARFFACERACLADRGQARVSSPGDELERLGWYSERDLKDMPLADITRRILNDITLRLAAGTLLDPSRPMAFHHRENGSSALDFL